MIVGDNRKMDGVPSSHYGAVVYDPPHVGPQGRDKSRKRFDVDFGATVPCGAEENWNLSYLYPPFLEQAKRVLKPEGLLLAKITDMVNSHRSKWPHCDFMRMAEETGFTVCDLIVKVRTGPMVSTKWKNAHHARKRHCFWIICRNGNSCEKNLFAEKDGPVPSREGGVYTSRTRYGRLHDQATSIQSAENLGLPDFFRRRLILDPVWMRYATTRPTVGGKAAVQ